MVASLTVKRKRHRKLTSPKIDGPTMVKVGFPKSKASGSDIEKAVFNEFGTRGGASGGGWGGPIPERPFMRNAMRNNRSKYKSAMAKAAKGILLGDTAMSTVLNKLGALAQGDIQSEITAMRSPPNSPITIALKGSSNPLIDTGAMRAAVTWKIENK
ncbi:hypothetical protein [Aminobacter phage Erebus]|nr:hypothetical protein [Aminobacter phage Erebus]